MLNRIIIWSLGHRVAVLGAFLLLIVAGLAAVASLDIDAFPDTTPVQVFVNTTAPALAAEDIELQVTQRVEQAVRGLPGLAGVRSISKPGLSQVVATFAEGVPIYFARQQIAERLARVELPLGVEAPAMGPVSTGLGEVFHYVVTSVGPDPAAARTAQDWILAPQMRSVAGTAEVNSWGGCEKRYEVRVDLRRLAELDLALRDVLEALERNNTTAGGGNLFLAGQALPLSGQGRLRGLEDIRRIPVLEGEGGIVRVGDVAEVELGCAPRQGAITYAGRGEAVLGLGFLLMGENTHRVAADLGRKLDGLAGSLPEGVSVSRVYDRTELVDLVIDTARKNLFEGGLLVIAILFVFLGHVRAGLIVALAIPLSMMFAFLGMMRFGIAGSLLSLGAIDFGLVVDSSVIMVENAVRKLSEDRSHRDLREVVQEAALEVRGPTAFGELIIMIVYLPILTLEGIEGKLFRPMALTVVFALAGSLVLSLTVMPVLASLLLPRRVQEHDPWIVTLMRRVYRPVLRFALAHRAAIVGGALAALALGGMIVRGLGWEFVPRLSEGAIAINVIRVVGTPLEDSVRLNTRMERAILQAFPDEVAQVWSRMGTAEVATDPMGLEVGDIFVALKPRAGWKRATNQGELVEALDRELRVFPGQRLAFSQPIEMRLNEMVSGVRSDVAVKIFGDDLSLLVQKASEVVAILGTIQGSADVSVEQVTGQAVVRARVRPEQLARYRVDSQAVMDAVEAVAGIEAGEILEGEMRFPLVVTLAEGMRHDLDALREAWIKTPEGSHVPLSVLAELERGEAPSTITREEGQRRIVVQCNVRGRDVGSFVDEARRTVGEVVEMPRGRYRIEWGGQFEHLERARTRLLLVVPLTLALILVLLYATYGRVLDTARVFTGIPFGTVGGALALWVAGLPLSISACVGFVALSGVSVLADMILVSAIRNLREQGMDLLEAIETAALTRVRPVAMTALVASLGFVPMALSTGVGAEVQRPLATVVIGGVASSTLLTLVVLPVLYAIFGDSIGVDATRRGPH